MEKRRTLLWIDLCIDDSTEDDLLIQCQQSWHVHKIGRNEDTSQNISLCRPCVACFNIDYPDVYTLNQIHNTRMHHPELPVIIVTRYHSEEFTLWAMRLRIWDIQLKPVNNCAFMCMIDKIVEDSNSNQITHCSCMQLPHLPKIQTKSGAGEDKATKTDAAVSYVTENYQNKISIDDMAKLCHMSPRKFSHEFKREHGLNFKEFLLRHRINIAQTLLENNYYNSITDVAMRVGFNDHSYFTRVFRRYVGINPSLYPHNQTHDECNKLTVTQN